MLNVKRVLLFITVIVFASCATTDRESQKKIKSHLSAGNTKSALEVAKSDKFFEDENSKLLKLVELATIHHLNHNYYQSLELFNEAQELSNKLYTRSISRAALSKITNDNMDNFYGEKFERSLIRFYQAFNHVLLYQSGKYEAYEKKVLVEGKKKKFKIEKIPEKSLSTNEKRFHLRAARATILEWDSLLENYKSTSGGKTSYKVDLTAKIFGAFIHEMIGTRSDRNIALNLYKDAESVLFKNYNIYPTYNNKNSKFVKDFKKLPNMSLSKVKRDYVSETEFSTSLQKFIKARVKDLRKSNKDNVKILISDEFVADKVANKVNFPIPASLIAGSKGVDDGFVPFSLKMLSNTHVLVPTISFELPEMKPKKNDSIMYALIKDEKGKTISKVEAPIINPISDIAYFNMQNSKISKYSQIGTRVAAKQMTALVAAYLIYKKEGELLASISYALANKGIELSEQADLRAWSTLPNNIRFTSLKLKPGKYNLVIESKRGKITKSKKAGSFIVEKNKVRTVNVNY